MHDQASVDRLSSIPNEILGFVLSFLPFKEATATSILSSRWRHTWRLTPRLDLDGEAALNELQRTQPFDKCEPILHKMRCKLFSWADRLIEGSANLEQFRLVFDLSVDDKERLDSWLGHVVCPRLERLELVLIDVAHTRSTSHNWRLCYTLPFPGDLGSNNLKQLKLLKTYLVNVSGEAVAFLLQNCPLLEQVSLSASHTLASLEIAGTHPSFKRLEISSCHELKSVVVRGSGLACIKYEGRRLEGGFVLEDVPLLTQLWISPMQPSGVFQMFEHALPQLRVLKIFHFWGRRVKTPIMIEEGKMPMLKELVLGVGKYYDEEASLLPLFINIIQGAPYLERFVVEASHQDIKPKAIKPKTLLDDGCPRVLDDDIVWHINYINERLGFLDAKLSEIGCESCDLYREIREKKLDCDLYREWRREKLRETERERLRRAYSNLKTLEFVGYRGVPRHLEIIAHFVENNAALESIIVDPRSFDIPMSRAWGNRIPRCNIEDDTLARECAKNQLNKYASSKINVKIL